MHHLLSVEATATKISALDRTLSVVKYMLIFNHKISTQLTFTCLNSTRNSRKRCAICSKLTIETLERRHRRRSGVFIVNFEHVSHLFLCVFIVNFEHISHLFPRNSVVDFEQVNVSWVLIHYYRPIFPSYKNQSIDL